MRNGGAEVNSARHAASGHCYAFAHMVEVELKGGVDAIETSSESSHCNSFIGSYRKCVDLVSPFPTSSRCGKHLTRTYRSLCVLLLTAMLQPSEVADNPFLFPNRNSDVRSRAG